MANEVIVNVRVLNSSLNPLQNQPVMLMVPSTDTYNLKANQKPPATVVWSGASDGNGYASFTGVQAGTYDIKVLGPSGTTFNYGYVVNNSYLTDPISPAESRFAVRSGEHILGINNSAGIIARKQDAIGGMNGTYTFSKEPVIGFGNITGTQQDPNLVYGTGINSFENQFDGTIFSGPLGYRGKLSGNAYYHDNQNLLNFQKIDIVLR